MRKNLKNLTAKLLDYFNLQLINKNQKIIEMSTNDRKIIDLVSKYSMTPQIRIYNLIQSLRHIEHNGIEGDYVECGVCFTCSGSHYQKGSVLSFCYCFNGSVNSILLVIPWTHSAVICIVVLFYQLNGFSSFNSFVLKV